MKKSLVFMMALCLSVLSSIAQTVPEPEFIGEVYLLTSDSTYVKLKKETAVINAKGSMVPMVSSVKSYLSLKGGTSATRVSADNQPIRLIVRCEDNDHDPADQLTIMQFEQKKKERRYLMTKVSILGGTSSNDMNSIPFEAKRYGESSYLIVLDDLQAGEYGLMMTSGEATSFGVRTLGVE